MLGSDLVKAIVDNNLIDKEITITGLNNDADDVENESVQIMGVTLIKDLDSGVIITEGLVEK